jgi:hypothetical protein
MELVRGRPDLVRAINQRWLLQYWNRLRGQEALPLWKQLEPEEIALMMANLSFVDVVNHDGRPRFLIRFHGSRVGEMYGSDCRGKYLDEVLPVAVRGSALATYERLVERKEPIYTIIQVRDRAQKLVNYERLLLPFGKGGSVERVLVSLETISLEGSFETRELMKSPGEPTYAVWAAIEH